MMNKLGQISLWLSGAAGMGAFLNLVELHWLWVILFTLASLYYLAASKHV